MKLVPDDSSPSPPAPAPAGPIPIPVHQFQFVGRTVIIEAFTQHPETVPPVQVPTQFGNYWLTMR